MAFTVGAIAAKDSAGTAITGGLLALDQTGSGPWALVHGLVDGIAGVNRLGVYVEDAAAAADPQSLMMMAVRRDTLSAAEVSADGDNIALKATSKGQIHAHASLWDGANALTLVQDTAGTNVWAVPVMIHPDSSGIIVDVAHDAADSTGVGPLKIGGYAKAAAPTDVSADADRVNAWFLRNGAMAVNLTAAGALIPGDATTGLAVGGAVAHDGADSGKPLKIGGRAVSAEIAAVANNDRSDLLTDLVGKLIVLPYANPENFVSGAITSAMTGTTSTSLVAAPASGLRNYITQITVSNAHATVGTDIIIQDGSGGTTLYTIPAAAVYGGAVIAFPTPLRQPTTATALFCANVTTGASTKVSASGYKGA